MNNGEQTTKYCYLSLFDRLLGHLCYVCRSSFSGFPNHFLIQLKYSSRSRTKMPAWSLTQTQIFKFNLIAFTEAGQSFRNQDWPTIKNIKWKQEIGTSRVENNPGVRWNILGAFAVWFWCRTFFKRPTILKFHIKGKRSQGNGHRDSAFHQIALKQESSEN